MNHMDAVTSAGLDLLHHHDHDHDHDHGDDCGSHHHHHAMVFHTGVCQEILFNGWMTTNALEMFGSCVVIFIAGILYEGLKYYRESLHIKARTATGDSQVNITKNESGSGGAATVKYSMLSSGHIVQTLFHIIQSTASYILMLVFMTYSVWLCMALVLGLAVGYFFFGWKKTSMDDLTEHCH